MRKLTTLRLSLFLICTAATFSFVHSSVAEEAGGAAAADPTASVNNQDFQFQYYNLGNGKVRRRYTTTGSYMLTPKFKLINELNFWDTNSKGHHSDLESFHLKGIYITKGPTIGKVRGRFAIGAEWIKELGEFKYGTSGGTDQIAPLTGIGWSLSKRITVITLVQHWESYREERGVTRTSMTGPRIIYIQALPKINGWLKIDEKFSINHESDNDTSNILEVQLGKMFTKKHGAYIEGLFNTGGTDQYDWGVGVGMRLMY